MSNYKDLDSRSLSQTLSVIAYANEDVKRSYVPTPEVLRKIESVILANISDYMSNNDLTNALDALLKMGYEPNMLMIELDKMNKLSVFSKDNCLRLLDSIAKFILGGNKEKASEEVKEEAAAETRSFFQPEQISYKSVFEKLIEQMQVSSTTMNEKEICRAFSILNRQLKFENLTEEDIHRTKNRAQFFLDKLSSLMQIGHALDFKSVFWSNKFLGSISTQMNKRDMYNSGEFSLDIRGYHA